MAITQAIPTEVPLTRRTSAALSREPSSARLTVPTVAPEPGQRGHLQHVVASAIRTLHYSRRTEQAYWHWTRAFVRWSGLRHPVDMGAAEIGQFLSHLATQREVSASTQRQAQQLPGQSAPWADGRMQHQVRTRHVHGLVRQGFDQLGVPVGAHAQGQRHGLAPPQHGRPRAVSRWVRDLARLAQAGLDLRRCRQALRR
jgi:hypothetical protein